MDKVLEFLSDYAVSLKFEDLTEDVVHHVKRRIIDTFGCALGGFYSKPPEIVRNYALEVSAQPGATVFGTNHSTSPELAAFANGVAVRYLDFNDTSMSVDGGHPSDNIPAVMAAAEYSGADMKTVIASIVLAYEIQDRFSDVCGLFKNGWDHTNYVVLAAAAGAGKALGLDKETIINALALAGASHISLGQIRVGALSMLKGCAAANAARNGIFAALMASHGLTGPSELFEGSRGWFKQLNSHKIDFSIFGSKGNPYKIQEAKYKYYPTDYECQCSIHPAIELRELINRDVDNIKSISIDTYDLAVDIAADNADKWHPVTRETADHSLPFVQAVVLTKGDIWLEDFSEKNFKDPKINELMNKIQVHRNKEFTKDYPDAYWFRIEITTYSGETFVREIKYAKGHPKNPMTDEEIENKFHRLASPIISPRRINRILNVLWQVEEASSVNDVIGLFKIKA